MDIHWVGAGLYIYCNSNIGGQREEHEMGDDHFHFNRRYEDVQAPPREANPADDKVQKHVRDQDKSPCYRIKPNSLRRLNIFGRNDVKVISSWKPSRRYIE